MNYQVNLTEMKSALLLDDVVRKSTSILGLLAGKDQTLLVGEGYPPCLGSWP